MPAGRGLWGSAWRRINVSGRFYRGSVISPGVTSRVPNECEGAPSAQDTQLRPNGREPKGFALDTRSAPDSSAAELSLAAEVGLGLASAGLRGSGLGRSRLDGLGSAELGGSGLGGAEVGGAAEVDLGLLEFAVVDLETTGWSPEQAAITEIGAVRVRAGARRGEFVRQGEFASLVNPGTPVPPGIADLTGITDWMLAAAPRLGAVLPGLLDFAQGCVLVAHNAPFDLGFLVAGCGDLGLAWPGFTVLDTVMLARHVMDPDEVPDCKLSTLAGFFGARTAPNHRALADARATADVLSWLIRRLAHRGIRTLRQLSAWPDVVT
jgi:DNA polymerase III epsilon subunit family exonuclease